MPNPDENGHDESKANAAPFNLVLSSPAAAIVYERAEMQAIAALEKLGVPRAEAESWIMENSTAFRIGLAVGSVIPASEWPTDANCPDDGTPPE